MPNLGRDASALPSLIAGGEKLFVEGRKIKDADFEISIDPNGGGTAYVFSVNNTRAAEGADEDVLVFQSERFHEDNRMSVWVGGFTSSLYPCTGPGFYRLIAPAYGLNVSGGTVNAVKVNGVSATSSGNGNWTVPDPFDDDETSEDVVVEVVTPQGSVWASLFVEFPSVIRLTEYSYNKNYEEHYLSTAGGGSVYHDHAGNSFINWTYDDGGFGVYSDVDHWTSGSGSYGSTETVNYYFWHPKNAGGTSITYYKTVVNGNVTANVSYGIDPAFPGGTKVRNFTKLVENVDDGPIHIDSRRNTVTEDSAVTLYCSPTKYGKHFEVIEVTANKVDFSQNNSPNEMEPSISVPLNFDVLNVMGQVPNADQRLMLDIKDAVTRLGRVNTSVAPSFNYSLLKSIFDKAPAITVSYHPLFLVDRGVSACESITKKLQAGYDSTCIPLAQDLQDGKLPDTPGNMTPFYYVNNEPVAKYEYWDDDVPVYLKFFVDWGPRYESAFTITPEPLFPFEFSIVDYYEIVGNTDVDLLLLGFTAANVKVVKSIFVDGPNLGEFVATKGKSKIGVKPATNAVCYDFLDEHTATHEWVHSTGVYHRQEPPNNPDLKNYGADTPVALMAKKPNLPEWISRYERDKVRSY